MNQKMKETATEDSHTNILNFKPTGDVRLPRMERHWHEAVAMKCPADRDMMLPNGNYFGLREATAEAPGHSAADRSVRGHPLPQRGKFAGVLCGQGGECLSRIRLDRRSDCGRQRLDRRLGPNCRRARRPSGSRGGTRLWLGAASWDCRRSWPAHYHG